MGRELIKVGPSDRRGDSPYSRSINVLQRQRGGLVITCMDSIINILHGAIVKRIKINSLHTESCRKYVHTSCSAVMNVIFALPVAISSVII